MAKEKKRFCYEFPRPAVTVDVALLRRGSADEVLLVQRGSDPFAGMWALPGGFVDSDERLIDAARRELLEETSIRQSKLIQIGAYGDPGRDPRGHTVSIAFGAVTGRRTQPAGGDDAAAAGWFALGRLPKLAFDHRRIIRDAAKMLLGEGAR
jgi:8-oxo-dGTP diphosphatase